MEKQLFISFVKGRIELQHDKTNEMTCTPNEDSDQAGLDIHPVWSESLQCSLWVAKDLNILHADREDSDQTGRMSSLIWVFAGRTSQFVYFFMLWLNLSCSLSTPLLVKNRLVVLLAQFKKVSLDFSVFTVDYQHSETSITPLMIAAGRGFTEVVAQLLNMGADAQLKASNDWTALDWAKKFDQEDIVNMLVAHL